MAIVTNRLGTFDLTSENDEITYDRPWQSQTFFGAGAGRDRLTIDLNSTVAMTFEAQDTFNTGVLRGVIRTGPYDFTLGYYDVEDVVFSGGSGNDGFLFNIQPNTVTTSATFDGRGGTDTLTVNASRITTDLNFDYNNGIIVSNIGTFSNLEKFSITSGSGNDNIITGSEADSVYTGTGRDLVRTGAGNDYVYSESPNGTIDLGTGTYDVFAGNLPTYADKLTIDIGEALTVSSGLTVTNADSISFGGGLNDDIFNIATNLNTGLGGGYGFDILNYNSIQSSAEIVQITGFGNYQISGSFSLTSTNLIYYNAFESVNITSGSGNDRFQISGLFAAASLTLNGGGGIDTLNFNFAGATNVPAVIFTVTADGSVYSNVGKYTGFEIYSLNGGDGNDFFMGGSGNDSFSGAAGNDILDGGAGADIVSGGTGDDFYAIDNISDLIFENAGGGNDRALTTVSYRLSASSDIELLAAANQSGTQAMDLGGSSIAQIIIGNEGVNNIDGLGGHDTLYGLGGDDVLDGGTGNDQLVGGLGNDWFIVDSASDAVYENAGEGYDRVLATASYQLAGNAEIELLATLAQTGTGALDLAGNGFAQTVIGNDGVNNLNGGGGNDTLYGLGGNDVLDGGTGADQLVGGAGNDSYTVDNASDVVFENAGEGNDRVLASVSYALSASAEVELLSTYDQGGTTALDLRGSDTGQAIIGNEGANRLDGLAGNDTLFGLGGNDVLDGGLGFDYLVGGTGADTFAFSTALGGDNFDRITDFVSGSDRIQLSQSVFAALGLGGIAAGQFVAGTAALDADDRILYDQASGTIWYDADGNGGGAAVAFAQLNAGTTLVASDFIVV